MHIPLRDKILFGYIILVAVIANMAAILVHERERIREIPLPHSLGGKKAHRMDSPRKCRTPLIRPDRYFLFWWNPQLIPCSWKGIKETLSNIEAVLANRKKGRVSRHILSSPKNCRLLVISESYSALLVFNKKRKLLSMIV